MGSKFDIGSDKLKVQGPENGSVKVAVAEKTVAEII
jgi:hypothetical protein